MEMRKVGGILLVTEKCKQNLKSSIGAIREQFDISEKNNVNLDTQNFFQSL